MTSRSLFTFTSTCMLYVCMCCRVARAKRSRRRNSSTSSVRTPAKTNVRFAEDGTPRRSSGSRSPALGENLRAPRQALSDPVDLRARAHVIGVQPPATTHLPSTSAETSAEREAAKNANQSANSDRKPLIGEKEASGDDNEFSYNVPATQSRQGATARPSDLSLSVAQRTEHQPEVPERLESSIITTPSEAAAMYKKTSKPLQNTPQRDVTVGSVVWLQAGRSASLRG